MRRVLPFACRRRISRACLCVGCLILAIALCISITLQTLHHWNCPANQPNSHTTTTAEESVDTEQIDVVYTWVNGSDQQFLSNLRRYTNESPLNAAHHQHLDATRYDDKNELLFSLRSLHANAWPWIRRVHIITNGQLPHWLDLDNPKIDVHTHAELVARDPVAEDQMLLPTFSSAAIETLLLLVPNLTPRFLYLNDDVFLGRKAFLSQLWTLGGGVQVFRAWPLPDCATDCPWTYVADGACDTACNCEECQWDGGDCTENAAALSTSGGSFFGSQAELMVMPKHFASNLTDDSALRDHVASFNAAQQLRLKNQRARSPRKSLHKSLPASVSTTVSPSSSIDLYAASLLHTQRRLNVHHGHRSRRVIGHVGFLLDLVALRDFHQQFSAEIAITRANRFRSANDLQFAFAYFHHLMESRDERLTAEIFDDFDTDRSGSWSDREIRTLLTRISPLPLDWAAVRYFEEIVANCSNFREREGGRRLHEKDQEEVTMMNEYERYIDSSIPHVSKELVVSCTSLADTLRAHFGRRPRFQHTLDTTNTANSKSAMRNSHFVMLTSNVTQVIEALDQLRQAQRLFVCINDNRQLPLVHISDDGATSPSLHHQRQDNQDLAEANALIIALLEDFYVSLFPLRSPFELADGLRNRFATVHEWRRWRRQRSRNEQWALMVGFVVIGVLVAMRLIYWMCRMGRRPSIKDGRRYRNSSNRRILDKANARFYSEEEEDAEYDEEDEEEDDEHFGDVGSVI